VQVALIAAVSLVGSSDDQNSSVRPNCARLRGSAEKVFMALLWIEIADRPNDEIVRTEPEFSTRLRAVNLG
jgi:hypothetical protein